MGSSETFCLRWNEFEGNVSRSFSSIRDNNQFFDCTLTTDDANEVAYSDNLRAHKVILSACSTFFRNILTKESMCAHPNPLIYLKGISAHDLKYILDFMYHGEVNVAKDELDKFLEVAETLKIKGLTKRSKRSETSGGPEPPAPILPFSALNQSSAPNYARQSQVPVKKEGEPQNPIGINDMETCAKFNEDVVDGRSDFDLDNGSKADEDQDGQQYEYDDIEVEEALRNGESPNERGANKRLASDNSSPSSAGVPFKKIKVQVTPMESPTTIDIGKAESITLSAADEDNVDNSLDKHESDSIEGDMYDADNVRVNSLHQSTRDNGESGGSINGGKGKNKLVNRQGRVKAHTHMNETERVTLVNLVKTLDKDNMLRGNGRNERSHEACEKRKELWVQIVSSFNEISGLNYKKGKLAAALNSC